MAGAPPSLVNRSLLFSACRVAQFNVVDRAIARRAKIRILSSSFTVRFRSIFGCRHIPIWGEFKTLRSFLIAASQLTQRLPGAPRHGGGYEAYWT